MNALALNSLETTAPRSGFGVYLKETQYELLRMVRNPGIAVPVLAMPLALYALFAFVIGGEWIAKDANAGIFLFTAFSLMAVTMPAVFGIGISLALEREMGLLRLKRAQPAPPAAWVVAKILAGLVLAVVAYTPIAILAVMAGKLTLAPGQVIALSFALLLGTIPFTALGLMIGSLAGGQAANGWALAAYLPGCYLSGMFFPLPPSMYWQAPIWPQFHVIQLAMHMTDITKMQFESMTNAIGAMLAYTVLFAAVTIWRLSKKG